MAQIRHGWAAWVSQLAFMGCVQAGRRYGRATAQGHILEPGRICLPDQLEKQTAGDKSEQLPDCYRAVYQWQQSHLPGREGGTGGAATTE